MTQPASPYRGRFAPSPTGDLHFGSLIAAVGSYCQARAHRGEWLVRIEDVDTTRRVIGSADSILHDLERFGFEWDGPVIYQSERDPEYQQMLEQLIKQETLFYCTCSRSQLASYPSKVYPGLCRNRTAPPDGEYAIRCAARPVSVEFDDLVQGKQQVNLAEQCGDFIVRRRDKLFAYHLAVITDDADQGITEIVRGADLLSSCPQQIYLQQLLSLPTPTYAHLPVAMHQDGKKLSKSRQALGLDRHSPGELLYQAFSFLGQMPPREIKETQVNDCWQWAFENWQINKIPKVKSIAFDLD